MIPPISRRLLDLRIDAIASKYGDPVRTRRLMGAIIVAQMMPGGTIKGGSAMKFRFGDFATRFTRDLDAARHIEIDAYALQFAQNLEKGWNGFSGRLVARQPHPVSGIPDSYIMRPFDIKLSYNSKPWLTVPFELGANELGDADECELVLSSDTVRIFEELGFPKPDPVPLMPIWHQIAQKLHGLTEENSERARDLVDLQIIMARTDPDLAKVRSTCERLFASRHLQAWPPQVSCGKDWDTLYIEAKENLPVLPTVDEAISWANSLISRIVAS